MRRACRVVTCAAALAGAAFAGQIAGTVVSARDGEPLASVELTLSPVRGDASRGRQRSPRGPMFDSGPSARTSLDGRFVFLDVEPGEYILGASKAGFEGGGRIARRIALSDDAPSATLSIELKRSPAIQGRVVDGDGDPLPNTRVELRAWTMTEARRMLRGVRSTETDDRGEYRLANLMPGAYLLYLHPSTLGMQQGGLLYETAGAYYPQGASPAEAAKIALDWGVELQGVDLTAAPPGGTLAGGVALREDGAPCPECSVTILDAEGLATAAFRVADTGRFAVYGLPAAEYSFGARGPRGAGSAIERAYLPDGRPIELSLRLSPGQPVSGSVTFRAMENGESPDLERAAFRLLPADPTLGGQHGGGRISAAGTFEVEAAPQGLYRVLAFGLPANGYLERALHGGAELPGGMLRVGPDGPVSGLELVVRLDGGAVQGQAFDRDGKSPAPPDGMIVLLPQRTAAASNHPILSGYGGDDASFEINGAAPGEYLVFAVPRNFAWDWSDPAQLVDLRRRAAKVAVRPRETVEAKAPYLEGP